jgi:hypothetical protein
MWKRNITGNFCDESKRGSMLAMARAFWVGAIARRRWRQHWSISLERE